MNRVYAEAGKIWLETHEQAGEFYGTAPVFGVTYEVKIRGDGGGVEIKQ
jgi:hypothetical protein